MKVFWLDGGLHLEPEDDEDRSRLLKLEIAIGSFNKVTVRVERGVASGHSSPALADMMGVGQPLGD